MRHDPRSSARRKTGHWDRLVVRPRVLGASCVRVRYVCVCECSVCLQSGCSSGCAGPRAGTHLCRTYLTLPTSFPCSPWSALASPCLLPCRFWGRSFHLATPATPPSTLPTRRQKPRPPPSPPPPLTANQSVARIESWALQHCSTVALHHRAVQPAPTCIRLKPPKLGRVSFQMPLSYGASYLRPAQTYSH